MGDGLSAWDGADAGGGEGATDADLRDRRHGADRVVAVAAAGPLRAGAAIVFPLASAVVAFNGWPQIGSQPSAPAVLVSHQRTPLDAQSSHRLQAASAAVAAIATSTATQGASVQGGSTTFAASSQ